LIAYINWNQVNDVIGYGLDVATDNGFINYILHNKDISNVTAYSVSGLNINTPYYYRVRAYNADGLSSYSNTISVRTITGVK
jgi:hypothetical protein